MYKALNKKDNQIYTITEWIKNNFLYLLDDKGLGYYFILDQEMKNYNDLWITEIEKKMIFKMYKNKKYPYGIYQINDDFLKEACKVPKWLGDFIPELISILKLDDDEEHIIKFLSEELANCEIYNIS